MRTCTLPKSIMARTAGLVLGLSVAVGPEAVAQQRLLSPPIHLIAPSVPVYQAPTPAAAVATPPIVVSNPTAVVNTVPARYYYAPSVPTARRKSSPPSMSGSSFSTRWRADLKASGRGFRP
jgi:hypothetical protein